MKSHTLAGLIIILIGLSILFHFPIFSFLFAFVILWIGVKIMTGQGSSFGGFMETKGVLRSNNLKRVLVFSGINAKLTADNFEGMELVCIFGGGELDANTAVSKKKDVDIEVVAIFGGLKLRIPKSWKVKSEGTGIIGGFNDRTNPPGKSTTTVHLRGVAIFGGVEIVN